MKTKWLILSTVTALLLAGSTATADVGQVFGNTDDAVCSDAVPRLTEANSNLYAFHSGLITDADDIILDTKGGLFKRGAPSWSNGLWFLLRNNFTPAPAANELVWVITTAMDISTPQDLARHLGHMSVDHYAATAGAGHSEVIQPLLMDRIQGALGKYVNWVTGYDVRWDPVSEFDTGGSAPPNCWAGGPATPAFQNRLIIGYNVYRLEDIPEDLSTPRTYLGGPDEDFSTRADNGWIWFLSLEQDIDLDNATDPDLDWLGDLFGEHAGQLIFSDARSTPNGMSNPKAPKLPPQLPGHYYTYVFQPVVRTTVPLASFNGGVGVTDGDGDGVMDSVDLNGDGDPEYLDPSGTALGLTYQEATGGSYILISSELNSAGAPLPAEGDIDFTGSFAGGVFSLTFSATLETSVAGYNIYRSAGPNDRSRFLRVNASLIPARGDALGFYNFQDPVPQARRMQRGAYYYQIEAVYLDGTSRTYGPWEIVFTGDRSNRGR